jgi:hypothetical protein
MRTHTCTRKQLRIPRSISLILFKGRGGVWYFAREVSHIERVVPLVSFLFHFYLFLLLVQVHK